MSLLNATTASVVRLTIQNDKNFKLTNSVRVQPCSSQVVQFSVSLNHFHYKSRSVTSNFMNQIGKLDQGNYKFVAEGQTGVTFSNEISIDLPSKNQSVFIQTDKAMYKPGDKVKFRVLVLDSDTKPATVSNMNVFITVNGSIFNERGNCTDDFFRM